MTSALGRSDQDTQIGTKALLETLPVAVIVVNKALQIRMVNAAAEQLLGLSAGFLMRQNLNDMVHEDAALISLIHQVFRQGHSIAEYGLSLAGPKISPQRIDVRITPILEDDSHLVISLQECSMARQMDRQLAQGRAARSVAGLAAVLAHEIKNPLSGIRGAAQLLEQSASDQDRELTQLICMESDRIRNLVDRMELFSDERPLQRGPVNIHDVLGHVRKLAMTGFAKDIVFQEHYDPSLPSVFGNRDQLIQVFLNLVKNSSEATRPSQGEIVLETSYKHSVLISVAGSRDRLQLPIVVAVRDNGSGIPEELTQSIFEPFVTTKTRGTGLGLSLVAKIVEDHGGIIELVSEPGQTVFSVFLPAHPRSHGEVLVDDLER
ncbi:MAG TPA: PAS domain-containing protein [Alphaproteobacteria bacterium]|nr:PAS domain-containing protein [Alphaproteobacteria bacterium]